MAIDSFVRSTIFIFFCQLPQYTDASCAIPAGLQGSWNDIELKKTVTFSSDKLTGYELTFQGSGGFSDHTCISNLNNVYVFKGDQEFFDGDVSRNRPYFLCMKIVKVSNNLYYYHLLSDTSRSASGERVYIPTEDPPVSTPTCDYCSYTNSPEDECRLLQKTGTSESLNCTDAKACLPCTEVCPDAGGSSNTPEEEEAKDDSIIPLIVGSTIGGVVGVVVIAGLSILVYKKVIVGSTNAAVAIGSS